MFETFLNNPVLSSIALTLLHFVWQGVFVAAALKLVLLIVSNQSPLLRYSAASAAMVAMLALPIMTFLWIFQHYSPHFVATQALPAIDQISSAVGGNLSSNEQAWHSNLQQYLPYISLVWFACVLGLTMKLMVELTVVNRLPKAHTLPLSKTLEETFKRLVERLNLPIVPRLIVSLKAEVPMAIGWIKPVVLLPAHMVTGLSCAQLEMLLLHELAHIKRFDYLVNFLQTLVEITLFFHPAVLWVSKQMRQEREYCSDDIAVAHSGDAIAYAHTLADTASLCTKHSHHTIPSMAMAASGGDLKQRVVRLVDHQCTSSNDTGKWLAAATIGLSLILVMSKQFLSAPQLSLTVGEMKFFNFYNNSSSTEAINHTPLAKTNLLETTIAQQLIASNNSTSKAQPLAITRSTLTPPLEVHVPKLIQERLINVGTKSDAPLQELNALADNTVTLVANNTATENSLTKTHKPAQEVIKTAPASDSLTALNNQPTQLEITQQRTDQNVDKKFVAKNIESIELTSIKSSLDQLERSALGQNTVQSHAIATEQNPYAAQIAELASTPAHVQGNIPVSTLGQQGFNAKALIAPDDDHISSISSHVLELMPVANTKIQLPVKYDAELIKTTEPRYPSIAKRKGIELDVKVNFTIGTDGRIYDIEFKQQSKVNYFKSAIIAAMNKWRFLPAQHNGQPVESQMSKIFSFNLA